MKLEVMKCLKFTPDGSKIIKSSSQDILNQVNEYPVFLEISLFGLNDVYSLIDISKLTHTYNILKKYNYNTSYSLIKLIGDSPLEEGVNMKSKYLGNQISISSLLYLYQIQQVLSGMNIITENELEQDTSYELKLSISNEDEIVEDIELSLSSNNEMNIDAYKYMLIFSNNSYQLCNEINTKNFEYLMIRIPEFNCWYKLSKKKYFSLINVDNVNISYVLTDSDFCFSENIYTYGFNISSSEELLKYCIFISLDIYFKIIFKDLEITSFDEIMSEALAFTIEMKDCTLSLTLSYKEMGIYLENKEMLNKEFSLVKLINKIIRLKP